MFFIQTHCKRWLGMEGNPPAKDNFPSYKQALMQDCHVIKIYRQASLTQTDLNPYNVHAVFTRIFFPQFHLFVMIKLASLHFESEAWW